MKRRAEKGSREEETKSVGRKVEQGAEQSLEQDLLELCSRAEVPQVPRVFLRPPPSFPSDEEQSPDHPQQDFGCFQPRIQLERDPQGVRAVFVRGWELREKPLRVLSQILPTLSHLRQLHLRQSPLPPQLLPALAELLCLCPHLRTLSLEGSPLPGAAFQALLGGDSRLSHLSLRSSSLDDAAAQLLGHSLGTPQGANCPLLSLVLSFNHISDLGAAAIAQGLRLNRSLLFLSLANNHIGDLGAISLAQVLGPFELSQAELLQRRSLLLAQTLNASEGQKVPRKMPPPRSPPQKKKEVPRKREGKQGKKAASDPRPPPRGGEPGGSGHSLNLQVPVPAKPLHPLLAEAQQCQGTVVMPGNRALLSLNLSHNQVTQQGLGALLAALEQQQRERRAKVPGQQGLRRLLVEGNQIPCASPALARLRQLLPAWDLPFKKQSQEEEEEEEEEEKAAEEQLSGST